MGIHRSVITKSPEETAALGQEMAVSLVRETRLSDSPKVLCLHGDLGMGKTTFTQGFAKGLGIATRLLSSTFIIVRRYEIPKSNGFLYHIDMYRLDDMFNVRDIGMSEILVDPESYVIIEWAEKLVEKPAKRTDVFFGVTDEGHHTIDIKTYI